MIRSNKLATESLSSVTFSPPAPPPSRYSFGVTFQKAVTAISHNVALRIGIFMPFCASRFVNKCAVVKVTGVL